MAQIETNYRPPESDLNSDDEVKVSYRRKYLTTLTVNFVLWFLVVWYANSSGEFAAYATASLVLAIVGSLTVLPIPSKNAFVYVPVGLVLQVATVVIIVKIFF